MGGILDHTGNTLPVPHYHGVIYCGILDHTGNTLSVPQCHGVIYCADYISTEGRDVRRRKAMQGGRSVSHTNKHYVLYSQPDRSFTQ